MAWHPLDWAPVAFAEIEKFPSAVLAHHYPNTPNLGDMTKFHDWPNFSIDLLAGGTPCQAFSVAGLRQGLADPRGNLTLTYLAVAAKYRPRWLVWENVPGVLSDRTNAFGQFLAGLAELRYGWAYRMLDAQYFGLAQRRKRVFVVACLGGWECAAAVLFEPESLRGDNPPSREARKEITGTLGARTQGGGGLGTDFDLGGGLLAEPIPIQEIGKRQSGTAMNGVGHGKAGDPMYTLQSGAVHGVAHTLKAEGFDASEDGTGRGTPLIPTERWPASVAPTLNAHFGSKQGLEDQHALGGAGLFVPAYAMDASKRFLCRNCGQKFGVNDYPRNPKCPYCHCMTADDLLQGDVFPQGTKPAFAEPGSPNYPEPLVFSCKDHAADAGEVSPTLRSMGHANSHANAGGKVAVAFHENQRGEVSLNDMAGALTKGGGKPGQGYSAVAFQESQSGCREYDTSGCLRANGPGHDPVGTRVRAELSVRRLTPKECERLQGFPDDYTRIPYGKKTAEQCPDGPRYKALGNSMAVPCMRWIGARIKKVDATIMVVAIEEEIA